MIVHIVFWKVKETKVSKEENLVRIKEILETLPSKINEIIDFEVGGNFNPDTTAFDISLYSTFKSKEDLEKYQVHPDHQKAVRFIKSVVSERAVSDYELKK
jgi:hypothetical protein